MVPRISFYAKLIAIDKMLQTNQFLKMHQWNRMEGQESCIYTCENLISDRACIVHKCRKGGLFYQMVLEILNLYI